MTSEPKRLNSSTRAKTAADTTPEEEELKRKQSELEELQSELADRELELANLRGEIVALQDLPDLTAAPSSMPSVQADDIHEAAGNGDNVAVRRILQNDSAKIDTREKKYNWTPLHSAAEQGHAATAELLLSRGAEVERRSKNGLTPLHLAAAEGYTDTVELLLSRGAAVNARTENKLTPLHFVASPLDSAAEQGHAATAELLLSRGAEIDARDKWDCTPLHRAAEVDAIGMANLLISCGAEVNARNEQGETPLDIASDDTIAQMLRQHGGVSGKAVRARATELVELGNKCYEKGEYDEAISDYTEVIRFDPKYATAYYNRGNAYLKKGERAKAESDFAEAKRLRHERLYDLGRKMALTKLAQLRAKRQKSSEK